MSRSRSRSRSRSHSRGRPTTRSFISNTSVPRSGSESPVPTTEAGTVPGYALYDTPSPDRRSKPLGKRVSNPPPRFVSHEGSRSRSRSKSRSARRPQARRQKRRSTSGVRRIRNSDDNDNNGATSGADDPPPAQSEPPRRARVANPSQTHSRGRATVRGRGGKARISRQQDRSPTPGTSDIDPEELETLQLATGETPAGSQYTWEYETVPHDAFIQYAAARLPSPNIEELQRRGTQNVIEMLRVAEEDATSQMGSTRRQAKIVLFPQSVSATMNGGGWHHRRTEQLQPRPDPSERPTPASGKRRLPADSDGSGSATKRTRPSNPDTATESESNNDDPPPPPASNSSRPQPISSNHAAPVTRTNTATTVLDTPQPPQSISLGNSFPLIPNLHQPVRDPVHARLRARILERTVVPQLEAIVNRAAEREAEQRAEGGGQGRDMEWEVVEEDNPEDDPEEPNTSSQGPTEARMYPRTPAPQRTYGRVRSHLPAAETSSPPARPNSPSANPEMLFAIERARSVLEQARSERESRAALPRRHVPSGFSSSSVQAQAGSSSSSVFVPQQQQNRRLDPISAARADIVAFNEEVARGNATSFVESATRANRRQTNNDLEARCGPMRDRSANGFLADDEVDLTAAQAFVQGTFPKPTHARRRRNRKKKPAARDTTGLARQVLQVAKIHLFAYALVEGIYQTRATFMKWAELIHEKTWGLLLPDLPYVAATVEQLEVLVNYIATLWGKSKERVRPFMSEIHNLLHRIASQQDLQDNMDRVNEVLPNSFHCASVNPRRGHYESPHIGRIIGAVLAYGPTSVYVQFPEYFEEMPITVVAFILALWQFCIEEWRNGHWESRELSAAHMLEKYEAHLAGLKELRSVAPRRFQRLQDEWAAYVREYSGASFVRPQTAQAITDRSELRPDTPEPVAENYDMEQRQLAYQCEDRMMQEARIASLEQFSREHREFENDDDNLSSRPESPTPAPEYDNNGRLTARSKGKGRAN